MILKPTLQSSNDWFLANNDVFNYHLLVLFFSLPFTRIKIINISNFSNKICFTAFPKKFLEAKECRNTTTVKYFK